MRPPRSRTSSTSSSTSPWFASRSNPPTPSSLEAAQPLRHGKSPSSSSAVLEPSLSSTPSKSHKSKSKASKKSSNQPPADIVHSAGSDTRKPSRKQDSSCSLSPTSSPDKDSDRSPEDLEENKDDTESIIEEKNDSTHDSPPLLDQPIPVHTASFNDLSPSALNEPAAAVQLVCTQSTSLENEPEPSTSDTVEPAKSPLTTSRDTSQTTEVDSDFISPHDKRRRRKAKTQKAKRTTAIGESESGVKQTDRETPAKDSMLSDIAGCEQGPKPSKPAPLSISTETPPTRASTPNQGTTKTGSKDRVTFSADTPSPKPSTPVHPLRTLSSNSTIVRTKALHKRSQSAQLPSTIPWNNHSVACADGAGARSGSPPFQTSCIEPSVQENSRSTGDTLTFRRASAQTGADAIRTSPADTNVHMWYSPFQSGLDISIDGEAETKDCLENRQAQAGEHPSTSLAPQSAAASSKPTTIKLKLPPFLATPSSFFESSPRTPRIMPFSQNQQQQHTHPYGMLAGVSLEDSWTRARSSSIGAPMTPQLDTMNPFDFGSGSRSAGCSRRNSIESNLMESLLSGKTRMFGDFDNDTPSSGPPASIQLTSPLGSAATSASSSLGALDFLSTMGSNPLMSLHVEALPDVTPAPALHELHDSDVPVFVNPWDTEDQYAVPAAANSTAYLSTNLLASPRYPPATIDPAATARQASLLRAMNSGAMASGPLVSSLNVHPMAVANESDSMSIIPGLVPSRPASSLLPSIPKFGPYPSVEMSLAAEVNKPPPLREIPLDDSFEKLSMEDVIRKKSGHERKKSHRRTSSNSNSNSSSSNSSIITNNGNNTHHGGGGHGSEQEDQKKPALTKGHLQRTSRNGQGRSGHNKSASLGSFLPPLPPSSSPDKPCTSPLTTTSGAGDKRSSSASSSRSSVRDTTHSQNRDETSSKGEEHHTTTRRAKQQTIAATTTSGRDTSSSKSLNKTRV
ncbi:hypothetical protein DFQ27_006155 [Actinomortierella ambigua]|uniref:Uncharacterized protein n=1 Tax=Actinomortierella ambigua TaxID=1343610 RepID=A0A9P6UBY9_9FUNG|nr:hypothetical protein DFQ27_006155 [Actinomortierella ambigua]